MSDWIKLCRESDVMRAEHGSIHTWQVDLWTPPRGYRSGHLVVHGIPEVSEGVGLGLAGRGAARGGE